MPQHCNTALFAAREQFVVLIEVSLQSRYFLRMKNTKGRRRREKRRGMSATTPSRSSSLGRSSSRFMDSSSSPSMVQRTGDTLVVRSVVSGTALNIPGFEEPATPEQDDEDEDDDDDDDVSSPENLPQCKIKRNYTCTHCSFFTQNPRTYLYHLKDEHKEKIRVYECPKCVYASKHSQKLQRHIHMVHVIGRQNEKLARKLPLLAPKLPPPPPLTRAVQGEASTSRAHDDDGEGEESEEEEGLVMSLEGEDPPEELEEMDDCEEEGEEEEEDEMMLDNSAQNSSTENDPEPGTSAEEIKCSICPFTSHSRTLVQRHENIAHLKKKFFRCTKCNYVTHMKARFTKHVKYHSMPMIKCDLCDFRTPYKWNLDRHYKNHQGDGEFKCPMCNFTADIKQSLTVHVGASDAPAKELRMADVGLVGAAGLQPPPRSSPPSQPPVLVRADLDNGSEEDDEMEHDDDLFQSPSRRPMPKVKVSIVKKGKGSGGNTQHDQSDRHNFGSDFIHPDDVLHKNGKVYYKNLKCNYCSFRAFWEGDILRHENKVHGVDNPRNYKAAKKRLARPIPNLIPLQQQTTPPPPAILRIPAMSGSSQRSPVADLQDQFDAPIMSEQDINELCSKSSNSALKDFASLIGEAFPGEETQEAAETSPKPAAVKEEPMDEAKQTDKEETNKESIVKDPATPPQTSNPKRKNTSSFFDKLKEKLIGQEASNLVCEHCGHESKCLSEALCHQKIHKDEENEAGPSNQRSMVLVGVSSTRCQHCRHRCKTSADLLIHLQSCLSRDSTSDGQEDTQDEEVPQKEEPEEEEPPQCPNCEQRFDTEEDLSKHLDYCKPRLELNPEVSITEVRPQELHPMENKVFVWNQFVTEPSPEEMKPTLTIERIPSAPKASNPPMNKSSDSLDDDDEEEEYEGENSSSLVGFETAPGFGSVTNQKGKKLLRPTEEASHVQKVYKCPKCNFWASAASRFHIHLVGHLNRKPFGCSQCDYRSNWRWDVAKHIRLKGVRDEAHAAKSRPRVLVHDDDSSRRNYSKYNKFLTLMTVRLGQTQSDFPPPATSSLPAPPRLIPAPMAPSQEITSPKQQPLRPPPPLRAATQHVLSQLANAEDKRGIKRPLFGESSTATTDPNKPPEPGTKRLLWRCKKCNYRGINKDEVLAHVRTHYQNTPLGTVQIIPAAQAGKSDAQETQTSAPHPQLTCDKCPFAARWQGELYAHQQHHVPQAGAIFKCYLCPFYVTTKRELLHHMRIHGVNEPEDFLSKAMQAKSATVTSSKPADSGEGYSEYFSHAGTKRYKCGSCPYETNARAQFFHHRQLHDGSEADSRDDVAFKATRDGTDTKGPPFRCLVCSYTVAKRHLLHQHLRVHGIVIPPSRVTTTTANTLPQLPAIDVSKMADVPMVWVMKNGKFLKMFKCRYCPHVNLRKVNIQEHEKMHKTRKNSNPGSSSSIADPSGMIHRCVQCTYQCNNAGVHQDWYPRSCALVDLNRSDAAQVKDLGGDAASLAESVADLEDSELEQPETNGGSIGSSSNGAQHDDENEEEEEEDNRLLFFCRQCPARFLFSRELAIHRRFHRIRLAHHCPSCNYTARQPSHLQAHAKVHTQEYQDRTQTLLQQHQMSNDHYKPVVVQRDGVWVVAEDAQPAQQIKVNHLNPHVPLQKHYACNLCPARFFKSVALSYHLTLHGGPGPFKCKICDYSVKMYGNLVRHEPVHFKDIKAKQEQESRPTRAGMSMSTGPVDFVPLSGTELFQHREAQRSGGQEYPDVDYKQAVQLPPQSLPADPMFGTLMHGNPKFIYPTYFKNGKMKEKRYKCHKCPSAFEKREQYKVHLSLHGSKQKYRCERCDYSVKYYANFIQHIRKHKYNDEARQAAGDEASEEDTPMAVDEDTPTVSTIPQRTAGKSISHPGKHGPMAMAERQQLMIQQRRKGNAEDSLKDEQISIVPSYWCPHCPYNSMRRDGVETHSKRHLCNNPSIRTNFLCQHCDYSAPQSHFLREHNKLHFRWKPQPPGRRPETYMQCDKVELWSHVVGKENEEEEQEEGEKKLVFQDKGRDVGDLNERFFPVEPFEEDDEDDDVCIDLRTGETISEEPEPAPVEVKDSASETVAPEGTGEQQQQEEPSDAESSSDSSDDDDAAQDSS
ncbi:hypothetical protein B566_EDAN017161 [Ephemera danica]|nr:hypothetical protein B566_EDAN017161 [Ephemera danica]